MSVEGMVLKFQPKGSMCATCVDRRKSCKHLDFHLMVPVLETIKIEDIAIMIVKCSEFKRLQ